MWTYYQEKAWAKKIIYTYGKNAAPFVFLTGHFLFTMVCHLISIFCIYNYYYHTFCIIFWLTWSIYNGSCFYMDYFSKKYEASL